MVMLAEQQAGRTCAKAGALPPAALQPARDEFSVDFDRYMIVYSDQMDGGPDDLAQLTPIAALMLGRDSPPDEDEHSPIGETAIGCYQDNRFVGSINFYRDRAHHPESCVDSDGLLTLWYPLACFSHVLEILYHEKSLTLSLIRTDLNGQALAPPMGAILTWPESTGKEACADR